MQAVSHFRLLGRVVAKALQDCRLLDLPLCPLLYRLALGRRVDLFDVRRVDPQLGEGGRKGRVRGWWWGGVGWCVLGEQVRRVVWQGMPVRCCVLMQVLMQDV